MVSAAARSRIAAAVSWSAAGDAASSSARVALEPGSRPMPGSRVSSEGLEAGLVQGVQQRRLAHPGLAADHHAAARTGPGGGQQ
jgi:hypothetical protein